MLPRATRLAALLAFGLAVPVAAHAERHPIIRRGLASVDHAIAVLRHGAHDFHGHRLAAMRELGAARRQLIAALRSD